jgi:DNA-binding NtrC family response regulator
MIHSVQGTSLSPNDIPEEILRVPDPPLMATSGAPGHVGTAVPANLREQLLAEERETIQASLRAWKGNMTKAAQELGMARNTLYRKVQKLGI